MAAEKTLWQLKIEARQGMQEDVEKIQFGSSVWTWPNDFCRCKEMADLKDRVAFLEERLKDPTKLITRFGFSYRGCVCRTGTPYKVGQFKLVPKDA